MELWHMLPDEVKLVLLMSLPAVGKGMFFIPFGICELNFSMEKTFLLCSLGSIIKVGYYFLPVYGAERYLPDGNSWVVKEIKNYLRKTLDKARKKRTFYFMIGFLPAFSWPLIQAMGLLRQASMLAVALLVFWFFCKQRNHRWLVYLSLLILPNVGVGILAAACLAYAGKIKLFRGMAVTAAGTVVTIYLMVLGAMQIKPQMSAGWEIIRKFF